MLISIPWKWIISPEEGEHDVTFQAIPILLALHYFCERKRIIPKASAAIDRIVRMCADARSRHLASEDDVSPS